MISRLLSGFVVQDKATGRKKKDGILRSIFRQLVERVGTLHSSGTELEEWSDVNER